MNIAAILRQTSGRLPSKIAFQVENEKLTFSELSSQCTACAAGLRSAGVKKGDRVAIFAPSGLDFIIAWFSIVSLGAVAVPVNSMLKAREVTYVLQNSEVCCLVVHGSLYDIVRGIRPQLPGLAQVFVSGSAAGNEAPGTRRFEDLLVTNPSEPTQVDCSPDDTATIVYTSGTTGVPKGAMLTHGGFDSNVRDIIHVLQLAEDMIRVSVTPLYHVMGLSVNLIASVMVGATIVIQPKLELDEFLQANQEHRATMVSGAPALHYLLVNDPRTAKYDLSSWRMATSGSAPLPAELMRRFEAKYRIPLVECYGLTEATTLVSSNPVVGTRKPGSVGLPVPHLEVRIFDDQDRPVPAGEAGEVVVRGPAVMKGYYNNPEATAEALRGGWLHTGDVGKIDADGYIFIVDRKKDMLICSGYNVYPREIEELLATHPAVQESAVVGVPDPKRGEVPVAFVILKPGKQVTENDLVQFCRTNLAAYKAIKWVRFVAELPRGTNRKVLKRELREVAMLGASQ